LAKVFYAISSRSSYVIVDPWRNRLQRIVILQFRHYHDNSDYSDHPYDSHDYRQRGACGF
jgi:hypothetical protein